MMEKQAVKGKIAGWLRAEMMLDKFKVTEENWRNAIAVQPAFQWLLHGQL